MVGRSGVVVAGDISVRSAPSEAQALVCALPRGTSVEILVERDGWYEVDSALGKGWVGARHIRPTTRGLVTDYLWQNEELRNVPLEPAPDQRVPEGGGPLGAALARTWNQYGGLLGALCNVVGVDRAGVLAVLHIESGGRGWGPDGRMMIRFENHLFRQFLGNDGLFHAHFAFDPNVVWQGHFFRRDGDWQACHQHQGGEWEVLEFARGLSDEGALMSISMGMPQIMGFNHALIGYPSVREMFDRFTTDIRYQILGMFDFVRGSGDTSPMLEALRMRNYEAFATGYNGSGQAVFYGGLIRGAVAAFEQIGGGSAVITNTLEGTYTVQPGDSLGAIAARLGVSLQALAAENGIANPDFIQVGQVLRIPGQAPAPVDPPPPPSDGAGETTYTVQPGDFLGAIAARFGVSLEAIIAANGIANPDHIQVGQVLRIPSAGSRSLRTRGARGRSRAPSYRTYIVLPGDTLRSVVEALDISTTALFRANEVQLIPGQVLAAPRRGKGVPPRD